MVVPSGSLVSLSCFHFGDSRVWWDFQALCNAQRLFHQHNHWTAKATESSVQYLALWRSPNLRLPETETINQGCIAVLFSQTAGQVQSSACCSRADLEKFKRCSKAEGVVLCHRAVFCRLSPSWNNTGHDWRWQINQKAPNLVSAKDTIPVSAEEHLWEEASLFLFQRSVKQELCECTVLWKRKRQWLLRKSLCMVHSIFPSITVFSIHSWIIKRLLLLKPPKVSACDLSGLSLCLSHMPCFFWLLFC